MGEFIVEAPGPDDQFAVFEDDGETGYLYLYRPITGEILRHLQIYNCSADLRVGVEDVKVLWSRDGSKLGVVIWDRFRGVMDLPNRREGRVWLENRETPGIGEQDWLRGFDLA